MMSVIHLLKNWQSINPFSVIGNSELSFPLSHRYNAIVKYKTAFYSFYLPVALALHMVGNPTLLVTVK